MYWICSVDDAGQARVSRSTLARRVTWMAWMVLFVQQAADAALLQAPWIIWLFRLLPLLLFLPGVLRDSLRSYIWLCCVSLGYFVLLVERLFMQPRSPLDILGLAAVVILFVAAMFYVRWRAREMRQAPAVDGAPGD